MLGLVGEDGKSEQAKVKPDTLWGVVLAVVFFLIVMAGLFYMLSSDCEKVCRRYDRQGRCSVYTCRR